MASIGLSEKPDILSSNSEKLDSSQERGLTNQNVSNSIIKEVKEDKVDSSQTNAEETEIRGTNASFEKEESERFSNILNQSEITENDEQGKDVNEPQETTDGQTESNSVNIQDIERLSRQLLVEGPISQIVHENNVSIRLKLNKTAFKNKLIK